MLSLLFIISWAQCAQIISFTPQGAAKNVDQVTIKFSTDMPKKKDLFNISCDKHAVPPYKLRWIDTKTWQLTFDKILPLNMRCTFSPRQGFERPKNYAFSTGMPSIVGIRPYQYYDVEPEQYFILMADGLIDLEHLQSMAYFEVEGIGNKVGINLIKGPAKEEIIKNAYEDFENLAGEFIVLKAQNRFPEGAKIALHLINNIIYNFNVAKEFTAELTCTKTKANSPCNAFSRISVYFSRNVAIENLKGVKLISNNLSKKETIEWIPDELNEKHNSIGYLTFEPPFPSNSELKLILPDGIKDELGRPLSNLHLFPMTIRIDEYSPLIKFAAPFGILESKSNVHLPVNVRNIAQNIIGKRILLNHESSHAEIIQWYNKLREKEYAEVLRNTSIFAKDIGKKLQLTKPTSNKELEVIGIPLSDSGLHIVELEDEGLGMALTNKAPMYVATGALVTDLAVHIKRGSENSLIWVTSLDDAMPVKDAQITIVDEKTGIIGTGKTNDDGIFITGPLASKDFFAFAKKNNDFSFASTNWDKGIENFRFGIYNYSSYDKLATFKGHSILDRMLAQPGDSINMKHILRQTTKDGLKMLDEKLMPKEVIITHQGSYKTYTLPFSKEKTNTFTIPPNALLGKYDISIMGQQTGNFLVSEYRLPLMKANIKVQGNNFVQPTDIKIDLSASYLSGGPAKDLKVKLISTLSSAQFDPVIPGRLGFNFFNTPIIPGIYSQNQRQASTQNNFLSVQELKLDQSGGLLATITNIPKVHNIENLIIKMEYSDPSGEINTMHKLATLFPSETIVGISNADNKIQGIILNPQTTPLPNRAYTVEAFKINYFSHRKRQVGGFYSYDYSQEVISFGEVCRGETDAKGLFKCNPLNLKDGYYTLQAKTFDDDGNPTFAQTSWSKHKAGSNNWWAPSDSDRIDIIPNKVRYAVNEKASIEVHSPYAKSTVLVTIERDGILDAFTTNITQSKSTIEVPMLGHYAPNVYISTLAVRGRIAQPPPTALVDLAKPTLKMGLTEMKVDWSSHELQVNIETNKKKYQTREIVTANIKVNNGENAEVALAVVDESLLRLKENTSWNILKVMMGQRDLNVHTSTALNQIIGRRHFGSKAKAPGGGGGLAADPRELFEPMLFWAPLVKLNHNGMAQITFPLNDSITSFRIVAVATKGPDLFGDGYTTIQSTKDLIIYSGFSPVARLGDKIINEYTIRNTTNKIMDILLDGKPSFSLEPNTAKTLSYPLLISTQKNEIATTINAMDALSKNRDSMIAKTKIYPAINPRIVQSNLFQINKTKKFITNEEYDFLTISIKPSIVLAALEQVKTYMKDYNYTCFEQQLSKGIVLNDQLTLNKLIQALPSYMDESGLLKFFPTSSCGDPQLTRYALKMLEIPPRDKKILIEGLKKYIQGKTSCTKADSNFEYKILLFEVLGKDFNPQFLKLGKIIPSSWKTQTLLSWWKLLKEHKNIPHQPEYLEEVTNLLKQREVKVTQKDESELWTLFSSPDQQAIEFLEFAPNEKNLQSVIARMKRGHWDTTMANAWAVKNFKKFQQIPICGTTTLNLKNQKFQIAWSQKNQGETFNIKKDMTPLELNHVGSGAPWVQINTLTSAPLKQPLEFGYTIERKVKPLFQSVSGSWHRGDIAEIELTIKANSSKAWVVVVDPIPAGATHLPGNSIDITWPTEFEERSFTQFISYAAYLPEGEYKLSYKIRLNSAGELHLPSTKIEAMYSPDTMAQVPNANWIIAP